MRELIAALLILLITNPAAANSDDLHIRAILGEAEDQGEIGMLAVACSIKNRPEGLEGVDGLHSDRYLRADKEHQEMAKVAWYRAQYPSECDFMQGADMWHSGEFPDLWRGLALKFIDKIGDHYFYRRIKSESKYCPIMQ